MNRHIRRWQKSHLSKEKRAAWSRFNDLMYGKENSLPAKAKNTDIEKSGSGSAIQAMGEFRYVDADGIEQVIDPVMVRNLDESAWAESQKLFPKATPCMVDKEGRMYDEEGRENVLNQNMMLLSVKRMNSGDYGPSFLVQCGHPTLGEITVFAPGRLANEALEQLSGIALNDRLAEDGKTVLTYAGDRFQASELPSWARFEYVPNRGKYNGYFVIVPAIEQATTS